MTVGHRRDDQDGELDRLRRQYPQWRIWRGRATGDYWAMPPPGHPAVRELISSSDISELAPRLPEAEGRHGWGAQQTPRTITAVTPRYLGAPDLSTRSAAMGGGEVKPVEASVNPDKGVLRAVTGGNLALGTDGHSRGAAS